MDLSFVKQTLANKAKKSDYKKIDFSKILWKPKAGTYQIRILPNKFRKEWPSREVQIHYGISKFPMYALTNWEESDPIVDFVQELRKSKDPEDWKLANKLSPKLRYFVPVIVRGEEELGVRLWEIGKLVNDQLLGIANNEDYGDFTDITDGRDFTVDAVNDTVANKPTVKCTLIPRVKSTPITKDEEKLKSWLENQPDILEVNRHLTYEQIKEALQNYLEPSATDDEAVTLDEDEGDEPTESGDDFLKEMNEPVKVKKTPADKFENLFKD